MIGDKLASGAVSATFPAFPSRRLNEEEMHTDVHKLSEEAFKNKYLVSSREYNILLHHDPDSEESCLIKEEMASKLRSIKTEEALDAKRAELEERECFVEPFVVTGGMHGKVIVKADKPAEKKSGLLIPRSLRKEKSMYPTTGHIIRACVFQERIVGDLSPNYQMCDVSSELIGKRVLFGYMSGTAMCFHGYAPWKLLDVNEIMGIILKEDVELDEKEPEPLV